MKATMHDQHSKLSELLKNIFGASIRNDVTDITDEDCYVEPEPAPVPIETVISKEGKTEISLDSIRTLHNQFKLAHEAQSSEVVLFGEKYYFNYWNEEAQYAIFDKEGYEQRVAASFVRGKWSLNAEFFWSQTLPLSHDRIWIYEVDPNTNLKG